MTLMSALPTRRRLRAPREHGEALVEPPFDEAPHLLSDNCEQIAAYEFDIQGRSLQELRRAARQDLLDKAITHTRSYLPVNVAKFETPDTLILSGHQPTLFHPGVWFKNLALHHFGNTLQAQPINLLIDNDVAAMTSTSIRVLAGSPSSPRVEYVSIDAPAPESPFEDRKIVDVERVASFADRVARRVSSFVERPLIRKLWQPIRDICRHTTCLGQTVAQARHTYEHALGFRTLEVPLSHVCQGESFLWFASHLLAHLPRLWDVYNSALGDYRKVNRIRSRTHPVAELIEADGWLEAPLWMWSRDDPQRRRLFARFRDDTIQLTDRQAISVEISLSTERSAEVAVQQLTEIQRDGIRIRPRALITTMFARLLLGDLFLHGIGGAKYDELTDEILRRFFEVEPPDYMLLSATMMLPIERSEVTRNDLRNLQRQLRDLDYNPDRCLDSAQRNDPSVAAQLSEKRRWIEKKSPEDDRLQRHLAITRINQNFQPLIAEKREKLQSQSIILGQQLRNNQILGSREWSFCLFPEERLVGQLLELSPKPA